MAPNAASRIAATRTRVNRLLHSERLARARQRPVTDTVLYESFSGNGMLCNPEAIFRGLLASPDLAHLKHVWVLRDLSLYPETIAEFADDPRVRFVELDSEDYYLALTTSKYLVNNSTFPPRWGKRPDQIYVNTWHGTPLKAMGYDVPDGAVPARNIVRNFANADYLLAPNDATESMFLDAYRMRNIFPGAVIRVGLPRIDKQFVDEPVRAGTLARLRQAGVRIDDDQKIVLYAPTWKGANFHMPTNDVRALRQTVKDLAGRIDPGYKVLLKVHQQVYGYAVEHKDLRDLLVPNDVPTNEVLAVTDVLVTDYSSIFVDFLASGRPVLFLTPDQASYEASRGLYLTDEQWPGPRCQDTAGLAQQLDLLGTGTPADPAVAFADAYAQARKRYTALEDGHSTERVIDVVFRGNEQGHEVVRGFSDGRQTILLYMGGLNRNGITSSLLNLLNNIDYERFDVSALYRHSYRAEAAELLAQVNPNVRLFARQYPLNGSKLRVRALMKPDRTFALHSHEDDLTSSRDLLRDEWVRIFGYSRFDYVVDFSGYSPFWSKILAQGGADAHSIFLHNDMLADSQKEGASPGHRANLEGIFSIYKHVDHLVSVSPALAEVNREKLARYAPPDRFTYARNTIDFRRILHLAYGVTAANEKLAAATAQEIGEVARSRDALDGETTVTIHPLNLPASIETLIDYHSVEDVRDEATRIATVRSLLPDTGRGVKTFVTAGRLTPEKNHARMIRAFQRVNQEYPDTRLVIMGTGQLRRDLERLIEMLGLSTVVTLAGQQANPFSVMANSDCFVLSSDHEGQPMVLLEALVLELPVVTTDFASVRGALPEGAGLIVDSTDAALADGMRAFLRGKVPQREFDYLAYNREAVDEFYRAIGVSSTVRAGARPTG